MKKSAYFTLAIIMAAASVSCKKESKEMASPKELILEQSSHTWYYFQDKKLNQIEKIQDVPSFPKKPWTEAVRISSFGCLPDNDDKSTSQKAYAIANRLGIIEFQDDKINLFKDEAFFAGKTPKKASIFFCKLRKTYYFCLKICLDQIGRQAENRINILFQHKTN